MIAVGIDVGGTNIKAVLCEVGGALLHSTVVPSHAAEGPDAVVRQIHAAIEACLAHAADHVAGIGIGLPGSIDRATGVVSHPPNLIGWGEVPVRDLLAERWHLPVRVDNDANCAALGEAWFGAGRPFPSFIGITLGTGVGSGIIINRALYVGDKGYAGEFGHMSIDYAGPACNCGNRGCIEAYVGNAYLVANAIDVLARHPESVLHEPAARASASITPKRISEAANAGDEVARGILRDAGRKLGFCIANTVNLLDINTFIIGGGVSAAGAPLFDGMREAARERVLRVHRDDIAIIPAALGNDAGMLGAAALVGN